LACAGRVGDRELTPLARARVRVHRRRAVLAGLVQRVEGDVEVRPAVRVAQPLLAGGPGDPLQRHQAGLARMLPLAHELHRQMSAADEDVRLAAPGAPRRADLVVREAPRADDRGVADPPRHLEEEAAGGGAAGEIAAPVHRAEMDGAAALRIAEVLPAELVDEFLDLLR